MTGDSFRVSVPVPVLSLLAGQYFTYQTISFTYTLHSLPKEKKDMSVN
ncbi:hypothetical protein KUTeg_007544 [Tegillarca granosa]|uniref:Uncharacterized protein n=1 Tax=Tegillarca granosa TaxID=220873 RepID=A0ABQ9FDK6_TEGGR|nr:hypothetical protein KUTeg_007544 [Tegillarca granosa]